MLQTRDGAANGGLTALGCHEPKRTGKRESLPVGSGAAARIPGFQAWGLPGRNCALALLLAAGPSITQSVQARALFSLSPDTPATAAEAAVQTTSAQLRAGKTQVGPIKVSYSAGQLKIEAIDATMAEVLTKVAALTGVGIDVPAGIGSERMPFVELGPGPAREVLTALLSDTGLDYVIQASDSDPEKIQSVLLIVRDSRSGGASAPELVARQSIGPHLRGAAQTAQASETPVSDAPVSLQPENKAADANAPSTQPDATQPDQPPAGPTPQPGQANFTRPVTSPVPLPPSLDQQTMAQQLQQMYQQRMQMVQQNRQTLPSGLSGSPGNR